VQGNRISGTLPPGDAGPADATVKRGAAVVATLQDAFTYTVPPEILEVHPPGGAATGGSRVVVTGTGFVTGARLYVGGAQVTDLYSGPQTLHGNVPAAAAGTVVDVKVVNPDGEEAVAEDAFTYHAHGVHGLAMSANTPIELGTVRAYGVETGAEAGVGKLGRLGYYFTPLASPGAYKAGMTDEGASPAQAFWSGGGESFLTADAVSVSGGVRVDFDAPPGAALGGQVNWLIVGDEVRARVEIYDAEIDDLVAVTDAVDFYRAGVHAARDYLVRASYHAAGLGSRWGVEADAKATALPRSAGAEADVNLEQGGFLSGTVHDAAGTVAGAAVDVDHVEHGDAGTFYTRADGTFRFALPVGGYRLHVRPPGTAAAAWIGETGPAAHIGLAKVFVLAAGDDPAPLEITLADASPVSGRVLNDATDLPVVGARVTAYDYASGQPATRARAREDGAYRLSVPAGDYKVLAEAPVGARFPVLAAAYLGDRFERTKSRTVEDGTSGADLRLRAGGILEGRAVLSPANAVIPQAGVRVAIEDVELGGGGTYLEPRTRHDGTFAVGVRDEREYIGYIDAGSPWFKLAGGAWSGSAVARLDASGFTVPPGGVADMGDIAASTKAEIKGRVTDATTGAGIGGVSILFWIHGDGPSYRAVTGWDGRYRASLPAAPQGDAYVVEALAEGTPYLREFVGGAHNGCGQGTRGSIILLDGDSYTQDFALDVGASISGVVVDHTTGDPVSDVLVEAWLREYPGSSSCCITNSAHRTGVRADGTFTVRVPVGSWAIRARPSRDSVYPEFTGGYNWAGGSTTCLGGTAFEVTSLSDQLTGAEIRLR
jgi:hypothetical protein